MESIFEGTWASGPAPDEFILARVLDKTGWSWPEWEATPPYIQRVMWDYHQAKDAAEAAAQERQQHEQEAARRHGY